MAAGPATQVSPRAPKKDKATFLQEVSMAHLRRGAALLCAFVLLITGAAAAQQTQPQRGGTIVIALGSDPETLNPGITTGYAVGAITANVFSALIRLGPRGEVLPQLATSWEVAPDGKTYTFRLRPNVRWHDGRPFTAADVKFSLDEIHGKFHGRFRLGYASGASITTPNPPP